MSRPPDAGLTRRRFLLSSALAGVTGLLYPVGLPRRALAAEGQELAEDSLLMRNPAFSRTEREGQPALVTRKTSGEELAFHVDAEAAFLWASVPTAEECLRGASVTVCSLLDLAEREYGTEGQAAAREEALAFLKQAHDASILVPADTMVYVAFRPRER